jgi:predicted dehydrogenase
MKVLIIGLGSMGKRRIRDSLALKVGEVFGFDLRPDRRAEVEQRFGIRTFDSFDAAMDRDPAVVLISTPPELHVPYARQAAQAGKHFLMEVNVVNDGLRELCRYCAGKPFVAAPSATMRFHPAALTTKNLLDKGTLGKPLAFTYHFGQYLPAWHPWEKPRDFYAGRRLTSGTREMVSFILVWLTGLFGRVGTVSAFKDKLSRLDADVDDVYQVLFRFRSGVLGHMLSDVVSHVPYRTFRLMAEEGVVEWDWNAGRVSSFTHADGKWLIQPDGYGFRGYSTEETYVQELTRFYQAVRGEQAWEYSLADDVHVLDCVYAADQSALESRHVPVPDQEAR